MWRNLARDVINMVVHLAPSRESTAMAGLSCPGQRAPRTIVAMLVSAMQNATDE
jgi:hypothetical protein